MAKPIIFSDSRIEAIRQDQKTVTRRIVKWPVLGRRQPNHMQRLYLRENIAELFMACARGGSVCPHGQTGQVLWVREGWQIETGATANDLSALIRYRDLSTRRVQMPSENPMSHGLAFDRWRSPIHMPRWASRLSLKVLSIRIEQLQEITPEDARKEGADFGSSGEHGLYAARYLTELMKHKGPGPKPEFNPPAAANPLDLFKAQWAAIHGQTSWDENPWVWRIEFERIR